MDQLLPRHDSDLPMLTLAGADASPRLRLIDAATRLFCRQGINATGVDAIIEEAGTAKATLYKLFGSKDGLTQAVLDSEGLFWRDWFIGQIEAGNADPLQKLGRIFPLLKLWFGQERFTGCLFINAVGEHDKSETRFREIAIRHKTMVLTSIGALADEAGAGDPTLLAHQLGLLIDGAIVAAMVTRDPGVADTAAIAARAVIADALGAARARIAETQAS